MVPRFEQRRGWRGTSRHGRRRSERETSGARAPRKYISNLANSSCIKVVVFRSNIALDVLDLDPFRFGAPRRTPRDEPAVAPRRTRAPADVPPRILIIAATPLDNNRSFPPPPPPSGILLFFTFRRFCPVFGRAFLPVRAFVAARRRTRTRTRTPTEVPPPPSPTCTFFICTVVASFDVRSVGTLDLHDSERFAEFAPSRREPFSLFEDFALRETRELDLAHGFADEELVDKLVHGENRVGAVCVDDVRAGLERRCDPVFSPAIPRTHRPVAQFAVVVE